MTVPVSIIIPVYKVDRYLADCLDSLLAQTLGGLEVICVNDCSPDGSAEILASYASQDSRIIVLGHDRNRGQSAARNFGLDRASGEYVFFLDPDDLLFSEESLAHLHAIAKEDNADEVIGATLRWYEATGERLYEYHKHYLKENLRKVRFHGHGYLINNAIGCNKLLKRKFLLDNQIRFNTGLRKFEDNVFSWQIHLLARSISLSLQATYLHRQRSCPVNGSIMHHKQNDPEFHALAAQDMLDFLENTPDAAAHRHIFDRFFVLWCYLDVQAAKEKRYTAEQKRDLLAVYLPVFSRIPAYSLSGNGMPARYREGLVMLRRGRYEDAWDVFAAEDYQLWSCRKQIDRIQNSLSWKLTGPLRRFNACVRKLTRP